jgi:hypothetical protein
MYKKLELHMVCNLYLNKTLWVWVFFVICLFFETGSHYVTQAGLKLNNSPVLGFQMLGLQACATTPSVFALLREGIIN